MDISGENRDYHMLLNLQKKKGGQSLQTKIMLFIGMTILVTVGISTFLYVKDLRKNYLEAVEWRSVTLAQSIHSDIHSRYNTFGALADTRLILESAYLQCKKLYDANQDMNVSFISVLNKAGDIIIHNDKELWGKRIEQPLLISALALQRIKTVLIGENYHTLIPVFSGADGYLGTIDVGFPKQGMDRKIFHTIQNAIVLCLVLSLAIFFPVWLFIRRFVSQPIGTLIEATSDIAKGDLSRDMFVNHTQEFKNLSVSLTHMRDSIRRIMEDLENRNQEVKALIACSPVALFSINPEGKVLIWTTSAERLSGWKSHEVTGLPLPTLPEDEQEPFNNLCSRVCQGEEVMGYELLQIQKDGTVFPASLSSAPIRDNNGKIIGVMGALEDITERVEREKAHEDIQEQLIQAQKMESVGRLAGGVAHDYNNMLGVIQGYAELVLDDLNQDDPKYSDMEQIIKASKRSADITRQLLAFARKQTISPKVQDLNNRVEVMLKMLRRLIGEDIELEWLPQRKLGLVKMDMTQIDQILVNICINARDSMKNGGMLIIETKSVEITEDYCIDHPYFKPGNFIRLTITDTGIGMNKEIVKNIFEPFFTTKGKGEGTGLGLSTVYGIVKQNNGFINVYSEPGSGTTFNVYIPQHSGEIQKNLPERPTDVLTGKGELVLLVEDEPSLLELGKQFLETLGYQVLAAQTPILALELAGVSQDPIQLLMTDVILPGMNGRELSEQIQSRYPDIKVLFMSGYTANVIAHHGVLYDGVNFIQKPFSKHELASKVREILDGPWEPGGDGDK